MLLVKKLLFIQVQLHIKVQSLPTLNKPLRPDQTKMRVDESCKSHSRFYQRFINVESTFLVLSTLSWFKFWWESLRGLARLNQSRDLHETESMKIVNGYWFHQLSMLVSSSLGNSHANSYMPTLIDSHPHSIQALRIKLIKVSWSQLKGSLLHRRSLGACGVPAPTNLCWHDLCCCYACQAQTLFWRHVCSSIYINKL